MEVVDSYKENENNSKNGTNETENSNVIAKYENPRVESEYVRPKRKAARTGELIRRLQHK